MSESRRRCYTCKCLEWESSIRFYNRTKDNDKNKFYCKKCDPVRKERFDKIKRKNKKVKEFKQEVKRFKDVCRIRVEELDAKNKAKYKKSNDTKQSKINRRRYQQSDKGIAASSICRYNRRVNYTNACEGLTYQERLAIGSFYKKCPIGYEVDHIIPVSKGGKHTLSNLQYLTKEENLRKSAKVLIKINENGKEEIHPFTHMREGMQENEITSTKRHKSSKYKRIRTLVIK